MGDLGKASQIQIPHPHRSLLALPSSNLWLAPPPLHRRSRFWPYFSAVGAGFGEKAGEGILDYVAGRPEPVLQLESEEGSSRSGSKSVTEILGIGGGLRYRFTTTINI
ncbi:hypothetical protein L6452_35263 [Arctium lappa]|uniref:Uncharacterized protein n=1 Tax=Arctium lappa TaxID=4217 RepID=A0ACB8Y6G2_ARCLA|nr:hypothetical protein L6452_35263 [Arctium lappa]